VESNSTTSSWIGLLASCATLVGFIWIAIYGHTALGFAGLLEEQNADQAVAQTQSISSQQGSENVSEAEANEVQSVASTEIAATEALGEDTELFVTDETSETQESEGTETSAQETVAKATSAEETDAAMAQMEAARMADDRQRAESDALIVAGDTARRMAAELNTAKNNTDDKASNDQIQAQKINEQSVLLTAEQDDESRARLEAQIAARRASESDALLAAGDRTRQLAAEQAQALQAAQQQAELQKELDKEKAAAAAQEALDLEKQRADAKLKAELLQRAVKESEAAALLTAGDKARELAKLAQQEQIQTARKAREKAALVEAGDLARSMLAEETEADIQPTPEQEPEAQSFESIRAEELSRLQDYAQKLAFSKGEWVMSDTTQEALDYIFETLFLYSEVSIRLTVYSADSDDNVVNKFVTQQRARTLKDYLIDRGLESSQVSAIAAGRKDEEKYTGVALAIREN